MSTKNRAVLYPKVFYQTDKLIYFVLNFLKAGHLRCLVLNQLWYGQRKTRRFHKKHVAAT